MPEFYDQIKQNGANAYIAGGTDVAIADGGTGASTAAAAFTALKQDASETATGVVERATDAEFTTGTDTTRYVSVAQVKGVAQTQTNKRIQKRVYSTASIAGTPGVLTPEIATYDIFILTAQAAAINIANHSASTPSDGEMMQIKIKDNGTARAITYGTNYRDMAATKATTTVISKWLIQLWQWSAADSKFDLLSQIQQP